MARSVNTDPVRVGTLDADLVRYAQEYARQVTAPSATPTGYGKAALRGVPRGAFGLLSSMAQAAGANPLHAGLDMALSMGGLPTQPIAQTGEDLANRIAPAPTTAGPRVLESAVAGGVGGAPFGPLGVASGVAGGVGGQTAAELGGGPVAQLLAGLVASALPAGVASIRANRGPMGAARVIDEMAAGDDRTAASALAAEPQTPGAIGVDRMGRTGRMLAERVAGEGGQPADALVEAVTQQGAGANDRALRSVAQALRQKPRDPNAALRVVRQQVREADARNYTPAMLHREIPIDRELAFLLDDPVIQRAYAAREQVAQTRVSGPMGAPANDPLPPLYEMAVDPTTGQPAARLASSLSIRALNEIKKGLDDLARPASDGSRQITQAQAQAAGTRLERIRARLTDPQSPTYQPDYAQALGESAALRRRGDLIKQGWQATGTTIRLGPGRTVAATPAELRRIATEAGADRPYFALPILERFRQKGTNISAEDLQRLEAVLPDGARVGDVVATLRQEGERSATRAAVQAAARGTRQDRDMNIERSLADVGARRYRPALRDALLAFMRRGQTHRLSQPIRQRLARVLSLSGDAFDAEAASLLEDLRTLETLQGRAVGASAVGAQAGAQEPER